ncbi:MAG TPA: uridine diphosphate-N-acetylglucosamine-binding protein YvcK [Marmoricola sp.]|nr:uridine diphosphate-N-acetylglucosamine-binding protein YvcK [Marmoricola sp.]
MSEVATGAVGWTSEPAVVALGGGHGLAASLAALRRLTQDLTAVVTVADNGGSSGRLREEFGVLPPGDLRMALAALCGDDRWGQTWARVLQHRFASEGEMDGHSVGNLLIVALWQLLDDHVVGLDWVASLLGARGRVLPMAVTPLDIMARVRGVRAEAPDEVSTVRGQVEVATTPGEVLEVSLEPAHPKACPEAVRAIAEADWVVLGPGSWYSSVIPHLLVPDLRDALVSTPGRVVVTLNLEAQPGETEGYTPEDHLEVLHRIAPELRIHTVVADPASVPDVASLESTVHDLGARLVLADVALDGAAGQHDPEKLGRAYARVTQAN